MNIKIIGELKTQISKKFLQGMVNRMFTSYYKYGKIEDTFPHKTDAIGCLHMRLKKYEETGNTEWLMDVANFAMIEFMFPKHSNAHFRATEGHESPGGVRNDGTIFLKKDEEFKYKNEGD